MGPGSARFSPESESLLKRLDASPASLWAARPKLPGLPGLFTLSGTRQEGAGIQIQAFRTPLSQGMYELPLGVSSSRPTKGSLASRRQLGGCAPSFNQRSAVFIHSTCGG